MIYKRVLKEDIRVQSLVIMMMMMMMMMMRIFSPTSGSTKSNSGAQVYKEVSKFLKLVNLERKILVMWACKMTTSLI